jgi:5-bromo-4-chloroindolyl phosphate hydrolysis protein
MDLIFIHLVWKFCLKPFTYIVYLLLGKVFFFFLIGSSIGISLNYHLLPFAIYMMSMGKKLKDTCSAGSQLLF